MSDVSITNVAGVDQLAVKQAKTVAQALAEKNIKIESSLPLEQLDQAARKRRFEELRKKMDRSRLQVDGNPDRHYFWAPHMDGGEMARLDGLGYVVVKEEDPKGVLSGKTQPKVRANGLKEDGTYVIGDVILMECSLETYEFIMLANSERHEEMVTGAQRDFRTEAERLAVPTFEHIK